MKISELIQQLEQIRDQYGDLRIFQQQGGVEYMPTIIVSDTISVMNDETFEMEEKPALRRVVIG